MKETGKAVSAMLALRIPRLLPSSPWLGYCPRPRSCFWLAEILFGIERLIGYGLMDTGVLPAAIDIFMQRRKSI